jgi:pimeloyl-ACP methyl ester carboxylesterase
MHAAAQARLDEFEALGPAGYAAARAAQIVHDPASKPELVAELAETMATMSQPGYGQAVRMLASGRLLDDVAETQLPLLVLCGEEDRITPPDMARRVEATAKARANVRAELALLPGVGHMIYLEATQAVATALRDFTKRVGR